VPVFEQALVISAAAPILKRRSAGYDPALNLAPDCLGGHPPLAHAVAAAGIERVAVAFQAQALDGDRPARPLRPPQPRSAPLGRIVDLLQEVKPDG